MKSIDTVVIKGEEYKVDNGSSYVCTASDWDRFIKGKHVDVEAFKQLLTKYGVDPGMHFTSDGSGVGISFGYNDYFDSDLNFIIGFGDWGCSGCYGVFASNIDSLSEDFYNAYENGDTFLSFLDSHKDAIEAPVAPDYSTIKEYPNKAEVWSFCIIANQWTDDIRTAITFTELLSILK